jgi:hypothetical protein
MLAPLAASADAGCLGRHLRIRAVGTTDMAHCIACQSNSQRSTVRSPEKVKSPPHKSPPQSSGERLEAILGRVKLTDVALSCGQAAELAGYSKRTFMELLSKRGTVLLLASSVLVPIALRRSSRL